MKKYSLISILLVCIFAFGILVHFIRESRSQDVRKEMKALAEFYPDAKSFSKKTGTPPHYKATTLDARTEEEVLLGVAFLTTDVSPDIYGYAGPIKVMVAMDPKGTIIDVRIISHSETPSYVLAIEPFLDQFSSKNIQRSYIL